SASATLAAVRILALARDLSRAHRPAAEGAHLARGDRRPPEGGAEPGFLRRTQSAATFAGPGVGRRAHARPVPRDPGISRRDPSGATLVAGGPLAPGARAPVRAGLDRRLPSADRAPDSSAPGEDLRRRRSRDRGMGPAQDGPGVAGDGSAPPQARAAAGRVLLRRC